MKRIIFFLFLFNSFSLFAQTINGYVFDNVSKEPLIGASVYFDGTTIGVITDENGRFSITIEKKITTPLIISYIGFHDVLIASPWELREIKASLVPKAVTLNEVVLTADPYTRERKLQVFRRQFLGNTKAGRSCKILNEEVINLYYNVSTFELTATADEAIIIENPYLGYTIRFRLNDYVVSYYKKSLSLFDMKRAYYAGTSFFTDKKKGVAKYRKRRAEVYKGSSRHLMNIIAKEEWSFKDFSFFKGSYQTHPENYFKITDSLGLKKVSLSNKLNILYKKKQQSAMFPNYEYYFVDELGNFFPPDAISFSGVMGTQRAGDLLPLDYVLK
ncbi:hypothetical protein GTQ40_13780 [Flavobacteriaceae bacterium R38]|nr:hypothetical protein [Flavobacteriaceae bacterium R38]